MKRMIVLGLLFAGMYSCRTADPCLKCPDRIVTETKVTERMIPSVPLNDSLYLTALFSCDSMGNVLMDELNEYKSRGASSYQYAGGKLQYRVVIIHDTMWMPCTDTIIATDRSTTITKPPVVIQTPIPWWKRVLMYIGGVALAALMVYIVLKLKPLKHE